MGVCFLLTRVLLYEEISFAPSCLGDLPSSISVNDPGCVKSSHLGLMYTPRLSLHDQTLEFSAGLSV